MQTLEEQRHETRTGLTAPPFCRHINRIEKPRSRPIVEQPAGHTVPRPSAHASFCHRIPCQGTSHTSSVSVKASHIHMWLEHCLVSIPPPHRPGSFPPFVQSKPEENFTLYAIEASLCPFECFEYQVKPVSYPLICPLRNDPLIAPSSILVNGDPPPPLIILYGPA